MTRRAWLGLLGLALLAIGGGARAHEIGTTQARFTLHKDGAWSAEIATPPTPLLNRLEAAAHHPLSRPLDQGTNDPRLDPYVMDLERKIEASFDGALSPAAVTLAWSGEAADIQHPLAAVVRAIGRAPPGARAVVWRYALVQSTYAVVFVSEATGATATQWLEGDAPSEPFPLQTEIRPPTTLDIVGQYLTLGFRHILPDGFDHILFVLGVFLLTTELGPVLVQVTTFTLAHSVTVGLTMAGLLSLSPRAIEPMITLSVAYVAIENVFVGRLTLWRPAVVFGFGLLHGLGFAGALRELRTPEGAFIPALVSFNLGIELAQLSVIAAAFFAVAVWFRRKPWYRAFVTAPASAAIGAAGLVWTIELLTS